LAIIIGKVPIEEGSIVDLPRPGAVTGYWQMRAGAKQGRQQRRRHFRFLNVVLQPAAAYRLWKSRTVGGGAARACSIFCQRSSERIPAALSDLLIDTVWTFHMV
jgi:hypothetical protein